MFALATAIFAICSKYEGLNFHRLKKLKCGVPNDLVAEFKKEAMQLTPHQLFGILIHMCVNYSKAERNPQLCQKPTPFDLVYASLYSYLAKDRWRLSQHFAKWLRVDKVNLSIVEHQFAKEQAPVCYSLTLHEVSRKGKIKMKCPGEITFCPIKHCRWCGLVESDQFVVCKMCLEDDSYTDTNLFCSKKCEREALEEQHTEEHARHLMIQCGIQT